MIGPTSWSRYSNDVTMPKLPLPPRRPQKRSGFSSALAVTPLAGRRDHLGRQQVVGREAALALEPAAAAAQREPGDPGGREAAAGDRQAVLLRRRVELAPGQARLRARRLRLGVDRRSLHRRRGRSRCRRRRCRSPAAECPPPRTATVRPLLAGEVHGRDDVVRRGAARDQRGMAVVDAVPDEARLVEVVVAGLQERAAEGGSPAPRQPGPKGSAPAWVSPPGSVGPSPQPTVLQPLLVCQPIATRVAPPHPAAPAAPRLAPPAGC